MPLRVIQLSTFDTICSEENHFILWIISKGHMVDEKILYVDENVSLLKILVSAPLSLLKHFCEMIINLYGVYFFSSPC